MPENLPQIPRWSRGPAGFVPKANEQIDAIERAIVNAPRGPVQQFPQGTGVTLRTFRITAATQDGENNRYTYTAKRSEKTAAGYDGWTDHATDTQDYTLYSLVEDAGEASAPLKTDALVYAKREGVPGQSEPEWWIVGSASAVSGLFPVTLSQTGGSAGSDTTQCTFTYTATSLDGVQLGTSLSPDKPRASLGAYVAATKGVGYFASDGTFTLAEAYEAPDPEACS